MAVDPPRGRAASREVRLLIVTIAISVAALLLLARFRFPEDLPPPTTPPSAAPALERLAARATFDELAAIIDDVQRRVSPTLVTLPIIRREDPGRDLPLDAAAIGMTPPRYIGALRIDSDTAVAPFWPGTRIEPVRGGRTVDVLATDELRGVLVLRVPAGPAAVPIAEGDRLPTPAYFAAAEASRAGAALRPIFVPRADPVADPRWNVPRLALGPLGVQPGAFVFSLQGELVGMTLVNGDGASLLPARALVAHAERLQAEGSVRRGTLGISVQPLTTSLSAATSTAAGVVVAYVAPGGPAEGVLRIGDIIEAVNAVPITDIPSLAAQLGALPAGQQVTLGTIRQGTRMEVPLTAAGAAEPTLAGNTLGLTVRPVENVGTEVIVVIPGSAAAVAGLRPGDLITAVNGARPSRLTDISRAWSAPDGGAVLLGVQRAGRPLVMALQRP
jgi:hypothetical protein